MKAPEGIDPALWTRLVGEARRRARDREPAHDFGHVTRVVANARAIARGERLPADDGAAACVAALLHEIFTLPKDHPDSPRAGDICAEHARDVLASEGATRELTERVVAAIRDHAFSKGVVPDARVARVLQDADRLDAMGAIGIARMWATCADMKRPFYAPEDPWCEHRVPNDKEWGLDHVFKKLALLHERLHTPTARELASLRVSFLGVYLAQLRVEIAPYDEGTE